MIGPVTSLHRLARRLVGRQAELDVVLDVFDHDDRVVDDDADRQHEPEERQLVQREAEPSITANVPTIETGTAISGMSVARHVCRNTRTTSATRAIASKSVSMTASIDSRTKTVGS